MKRHFEVKFLKIENLYVSNRECNSSWWTTFEPISMKVVHPTAEQTKMARVKTDRLAVFKKPKKNLNLFKSKETPIDT